MRGGKKHGMMGGPMGGMMMGGPMMGGPMAGPMMMHAMMHGMAGGPMMPGMMGGPMMHGMMGMLRRLRALDLSDEQWERLRGIHTEAKKQIIRKEAEMRVAGIDLMQWMRQPNADRARVEDAVRDLGRQWTELRLIQTQALLDALAVLTDDQRRKLWRGGAEWCPMCGPGMGEAESMEMGEGGEGGEEGAGG